MNTPFKFDDNDLFVLDLANNHQGQVHHGLRIIREVSEIVNQHQVRAAFKFQFRQLDTFIHPDHQQGSDHKQVKRFISTRLEQAEFAEFLSEVRQKSLLAMCTPFDEESVDLILEMDFDILKVASCSARDWPLLEKIADAGKPVVASTGGLDVYDIDNLVSFFQHRGVDYALMHCVSIYPTPNELCHLNQIDRFRQRYPHRPIGWSTHENPDELAPVQIAVAKGAMLFERHVGIPTDSITLNAYSSTPDQIDRWIKAYKQAKMICGSVERLSSPEVEKASIDGLKRGVFAREEIPAGSKVTRDLVYFAMPFVNGQISSSQWKEGITALETVHPDAPLMEAQVNIPSDPDRLIIQRAVHEIKAMLNEAKIALNSEFKVEYSHHYGIKNFRETGAILIDCVNREYCKKLIIQLPGQRHPLHFHKRKEETFQVLHGVLNVEVDGHYRELHPGSTILIQPGVWHQFWADTGVIFEEISTTHYNDDSFYKDKVINKMQRSERKTVVDHWGRFQLVSEREEITSALPG